MRTRLVRRAPASCARRTRPTTAADPAPRPDRGQLYVGTSGFAYPGWAPRFYAAGLKAAGLLPAYAARLTAVELNNTFYQQPTAAKVQAWLDATPATFRFSVKAQRGGSFRAFGAGAAAGAAPEPGLPWLTGPYRAFGERLGTVLFRVPDNIRRDDGRLAALLQAWPDDVPLTLDFGDPSWQVDETVEALTARGAVLCATDLPEDPEPPTLRRTGPFLYLRLRRHDYDAADIAAWAARLEPFLDAGDDAFVFFRHDDAGRGPEMAMSLLAAVGAPVDPA